VRNPIILFAASLTLRQRTISTLWTRGAAAAVLLSLAACGSGKPQHDQVAPEAGYVVVQQSSVPLTIELGGRTSAYQQSQVRPQVSGVIRKRFFTEGSIVRKGQPLYEIDPSLYRASVNQAQANLSNAEATAAAAKIKADRYKPLADVQAVSKQDYTDAAAAAREAAAAVQQQKAALETARINLHYTTVPAPITGRIGRSLFTEGALVTANQTDPLAEIQRLDPIYVDIQESASDLLKLRQSLATNGVVPAEATVRLKLDDGSDYGQVGKVEFSEAVVDPDTGTVTLRARFANPQGLLLPGMFVRAEFAQAVDPHAILVPQQGVAHDPKGNATVLVIGPGNKVVQKTVTTSRTQGTDWVVTGGLKPGDKVITQGSLNATPGTVVRPVPASSPQEIGGSGKDGTSKAAS